MELRGFKERVERLMVSEEWGDCVIHELQCITNEALSNELSFPLLELPVNIICDIFSRLPLKDIFRCICVCKMFLKLLRDPYFAKIHLTRAHLSSTNLILKENLVEGGLLHFFTFDFGESTLVSCSSDDQNIRCYFPNGLNTLSKQDAEFRFRTQRFTLIGSCNGLFCLRFHIPAKPFFAICNPILHECIELPHLVGSAPGCGHTVNSGFGYCPRTKQYKVINFKHQVSAKCLTSIYSMVAEIHTLGSDSWRRIENAPWPKTESFSPFLNGALHWITGRTRPSELICSFDLEEEKFRLVPPPEHFDAQYVNKVSWINTGVLRDCLCICYIYENCEFEVWVMGEYGIKESWTKEFSIDLKHYSMLQVQDLHRPIKFLSNGDLLFLACSDSLLLFSPKKRTFMELRVVFGLWRSYITAHDLSFISLKDVVGAKGPEVKSFKVEGKQFTFGV